MTALYLVNYDRAVTTASPQSEPEVLTMGSGEAGRLSRRGKQVLIAVVVALLAGLMLWRFWPEQAPLFSLSDLRGVYAGMVRSDGTSEASVINPRLTTEEDGYIISLRMYTVVRGDRAEPGPSRGARRSWHLLGAQ